MITSRYRVDLLTKILRLVPDFVRFIKSTKWGLRKANR